MEEHVPRGGGQSPPIPAAGGKPMLARHTSFVSVFCLILTSCDSVARAICVKGGSFVWDSARSVLNLLLFVSAPPLRCELLVRQN
jgi:hypothetical protein